MTRMHEFSARKGRGRGGVRIDRRPGLEILEDRIAPAAALAYVLTPTAANISAVVTATDPAGDVVAGSFSGTAGGLVSQGGNDAFVAQYNAAGALLWVHDLGGKQNDAGLGVTTDASGNVYIAGYFQGQASFGVGTNATLTAQGQTDAFVVKLNSAGTFQWAHDIGGPLAFDAADSIAVDPAGNVYVAGLFAGSTNFDPRQSNFTIAAATVNEGFVAKLDTNGNFLWAHDLGASVGGNNSIAVDAGGNTYVASDYIPLHAVSQVGIVNKLDTNGNVLWTTTTLGAGFVPGDAVAVDAAGNVFITGKFAGSAVFGSTTLTAVGNQDAFVAKLDNAGNFLWTQAIGGPAAVDTGAGIAVDVTGNVYVTGAFSATSRFSNFTPTALGSSDAFMTKLDTSGKFLWVRDAGGSKASASGAALAVNAAGNIYAAGSFSGTVNFDPGASNLSRTTTGTDFFLSKLTQSVIKGTVTNAAAPVAGVVVHLYGSRDAIIGNTDDLLLGTTLTDSKGNYQFMGPGDDDHYYVVFGAPVGMSFAKQGAASSADSTGKTALFALTVGSVTTENVVLTGAPPGFGSAIGGGSQSEAIEAMCTDAAGNVYVTGDFSGTMTLGSGAGSQILVAQGTGDAFVAKYSAGDALIWARDIGSTQGIVASFGIAVDPSGSVYITGAFGGKTTFGATTLSPKGGIDPFLSKLDSAGTFLWVQDIGSQLLEFGIPQIAVDSSGNVYLSGSFPGIVSFIQVYVSKLDSYGDFLWTKDIGGTKNSVTESAFTLDSQGNIYIAGTVLGEIPATIMIASNSLTLTSSSTFVTKLDSNGNCLWARQISLDVPIIKIATDADGNVYLGDSVGFLTKLDSNDNLLWTRDIGGRRVSENPNAQIGGIAVDSTGNVYVSGIFSNAASFGNWDLTAMTADDTFVTKLDSAGNFAWAQDINTNSRFMAGASNFGQNVSGFAVGPSDNLIVTGFFSGTADFDPGVGVFNLTGPSVSSDTLTSFLLKLTPNVVQGTAVNAQKQGLAGVAVNLYGSRDTTIGNGDDVLLGSTQTDSQGHYQFVSPGDALHYYIVFGAPAGYAFPTFAASASVDSTGKTKLFSLGEGQTVTQNVSLTGAAPAFGWAVDSSTTSEGNIVTRDGAGNVYVAGTFFGTTMTLGSGANRIILAGNQGFGLGYTLFVAKYDPSGALLWAQSFIAFPSNTSVAHGPQFRISGMTLDTHGNLYLAGTFAGTTSFGSITLNALGALDGYVAKLDSSGHVLWAQDIGGMLTEVGCSGVAVDANGNVYVTGSSDGTVSIGTLAPLTGLFVTKLDSGGNFLWASHTDTNDVQAFFSDSINGIGVDAAGNVYIVGQFQDMVTFGTQSLNEPSFFDTFVAKLDSSGNFIWARDLGGNNRKFVAPMSVVVNASGSVFIAYNPERSDTDFFRLDKLDSAGNALWIDDLSNGISVAGLTLDTTGNLYVTGYFVGMQTFGSTSLTAKGSRDSFVSQLDESSGQFLSTRDIGSIGADTLGSSIAVGAGGDIYLTGNFAGTLVFGSGAGAVNLTGDGTFFVARLAPSLVQGKVVNAQKQGLAGVAVRLYGSTDATIGNGDDVLLASTVTDSQGNYQLINPAVSAHYYVVFGAPLGTTFAPRSASSSADSSGKTALFTLGQGQTVIENVALTGALPGIWAVNGGDADIDIAQAVATDAAGNVYITGSFQDKLTLGSGSDTRTLTSSGDEDIFVAKYSAAGALVWAQQMGGTETDQGLGIAVDSQGNAYVTGAIEGTAQFGSASVVADGPTAAFIAQIDSDGTLGYVWDATGPGSASGLGVAVDSAGNVYATGTFSGLIHFDSTGTTADLTSAGPVSAFVVKITDGVTAWAEAVGGTGSAVGEAIAASASGVVVTGSFQGTVTLPGNGGGATGNPTQGPLPAATLTASGSSALLVAGLDPSGNFLWARQSTGTFDTLGAGVALDPAGNVYVTGSFAGPVNFDPGHSNQTLSSFGAQDAFVMMYNSAGTFDWVHQMGGAGSDSGGQAIAVDGLGNVYVTGSFTGTAQFDGSKPTGYTMTSRGGLDAFMTELSSGGSFLTARALGGIGDDAGYGIAVGPSDDIWITGSFEQTGNFGPGPSSIPLTSHGGDDFFLSRWQQPLDLLLPPVIAGETANQAVSVGSSVAPFKTLTVSAPDQESILVTVTILNGVNRGDFTAAPSGWTRTVVNSNIVYTQTFSGVDVGSLIQASLQTLTFQPRPNAVSGEKTLFTVGLSNGIPSDGVLTTAEISTKVS